MFLFGGGWWGFHEIQLFFPSVLSGNIENVQVKRLYDTFHEPFKRVVPNQPLNQETQIHFNGKPSSATGEQEVEKEIGAANKRKKKEPELSIKSALSAAFAKYSDRIGSKNNKTHKNEGESEKSPAAAEATEKIRASARMTDC